jgi:hypothetical protein
MLYQPWGSRQGYRWLVMVTQSGSAWFMAIMMHSHVTQTTAQAG